MEHSGTSNTGSPGSNAFTYTGREDDGTGLKYYRARYYHPTLQRFISEDPIEFEGGDSNLYAYVDNLPTQDTDALGLFGIEDLPTIPHGAVNAVAGFGDAFLIPIVARRYLFQLNDDVDLSKCSTEYKAGKVAGIIVGTIPFALRGAAWLGGTRLGRSIGLNNNPNFRIGPGRWGKDMVPRISSPYLPGDGHYSLVSRLPLLPPAGAASGSARGCK